MAKQRSFKNPLKLIPVLLFGASSVAHSGGLAAGSKAPDFSAPNQDGKVIQLKELMGKPVLLYFYPKDDTPGCTKQACLLRDTYQKFQQKGAVIFGVSRQDAKSHIKFKKKYNLPFDLLTDGDGSIAKAFGVSMYPVVGVHKRESVLIGKDGNIIRHYSDVDPETHAEMVLKDLP